MTEEEIKKEELRILIAFRNFCDERNLKYVLAYGTLLGAVRHKGFIPWDNDIDVMMLREDYEKLIKLYPENLEDTWLLSYRKDPDYIYPFTKIVSKRTYVREENTQEKLAYKKMGIWIDIFPVDNIGDNPPSNHWRQYRYYQRAFMCKMKGLRKFTNNYLHFDRIFRYGIFCSKHSLADIRRMMDLQMKKYFDQPTKYVSHTVWCTRDEKTERAAWDELVPCTFEGEEFTTYNDKYTKIFLTQCYGSSYMTPPPERKRIPHAMEAYWRDEN